MHGKPGWEEPLVKIPKSYHNGVASLNISMRNLIIIIIIIIIIITISFKEILETRNSLKMCKIGRYLGKTRDRDVEAVFSVGGLEKWNTSVK